MALALAWQFTPLKQALKLDDLIMGIRQAAARIGPLAAVGGFALACVVAVPLSVLMLVTVLAFGPLLGVAYGVTGATIGAATSFLIGRRIGRRAMQKLAGARLAHIDRQLGRRGVLSATMIRLVPVAPFAVVNMLAGVSAIRLRHFLIGNLLGMLPMTLASALFAEQIVRAVARPNGLTLALLGITLALIVAGSAVLRRWWREAED
ncbi:TVP38/TMEM64 family protein [Niveibacterium umoris]|uniref:TVP38/TMEM64 family membrane protein n=2 Tax=Niveibacterium umoris TaxID=1193620 RepID=A0A840BCM2_9RHOO|nr:VTT domain-containing protein [Niveibacterium umoris]MBB4010825.1 putative membrane protein YdjX (TVP38/TMEM64 family) [Niveibacterium umoris]